MTPRLRIEELPVGDVTILRPFGRLEVEEGNLLLRDRVNDLVQRGRVRIVLDLAGVTRLDSMGIGVLASKLATTRRQGGAIKLLRPTAQTVHLLDITGLLSVFEIFEDEHEAIRSFRADAAAT